MKSILFILVSVISSSVFALCIDPSSSAADKKAVGAEMSRIASGIKFWKEVKVGTSLLETKNTIEMNIDFLEPFKTKFSAGKETRPLTSICAANGIVSINGGVAVIRKSGDRMQVKVPLVGTYEVLPTKKVRQQKAELPQPKHIEQQSQDSTVIS